MRNKILLALSLSAVTLTAISSVFDVPLAKRCYSVSRGLVKIRDIQTVKACFENINLAATYSEDASFKIAEDDRYYSDYYLELAIKKLRYAQVLSCIEEEKIMQAEKDLNDIREEANRK